MRHSLIVLSLLLGPATAPSAQPYISVESSVMTAGNIQVAHPEFVLVPDHPVYYAPRLQVNLFYYDGLYWMYHDDRWYVSALHDGPWDLVHPDSVPPFVLRVPVRYYVNPPVYFHGWYVDAPPRWDIHWGPRWAQHRRGWDRWDRHAVRPHAPPPVPRHFSGDRHPRVEPRMQRNPHHPSPPREAVVRPRFQEPAAPRAQSPQRRREDFQRQAPAQAHPQGRVPAVEQQRPQLRQAQELRVQQAPRPAVQERAPQVRGDVQRFRPGAERRDGPRPERAQDRGRERGQGR